MLLNKYIDINNCVRDIFLNKFLSSTEVFHIVISFVEVMI